MKKPLRFEFNEWAPVNWVKFGIALIIAESFLGGGPSLAGQARPAWEAEWEKTVEAARQEGQVTMYGTSPNHAIVDSGRFQKAYPGIKVVAVAPAPGEAFQRLVAERRAGKYLADLYIAGVTTPIMLHQMKVLEPIKPMLILPEVVDESKWWGGKHNYNDHEQKYIFVFTGNPLYGSIFYNTNLVNVKEIRSFWDLVNPKWKGKIEVRDIRIPGTGNINTIFFYHNPQLGPKFIRRLYGEMDVTLFRDIRQSLDWLANGKFAICFFCYPVEAAEAKKQGLPLNEFGLLKEGATISSHAGGLTLLKNAPHPNAAKVFINWLLSRDGQMISQETGRGRVNSRRIDIPKEIIPPAGRLMEGVKYLEVETPELNDIGPVLKVIEEALADRKKGS
jgi:iron(III) transport system substrate-binding protein